MSIWRYANPLEFMRLTGRLLTPLWAAAGVLLAVGLGWAVFGTPDDYRQGSTVKILFTHVPAAMLSINIEMGFRPNRLMAGWQAELSAYREALGG